MFVLDAGASEIVKLSPAGKPLRTTGGFGWKEGSMDQPADISASNGLDVFVADFGNHRILRFDRDLNLQSSAASPSRDDPHSIPFGYPRSVTMSRFGELFIVDGENNRVLTVAGESGEGKLFGDLHGGTGSLRAPERVRVSAGDMVFVQDSGRIVQYDMFGNYLRAFGREFFPGLRTFAVDGKNLYVLDSCRIAVVDDGGTIRSHFSIPAMGDGLRCDAVVDFQIRQGTIFLLTPQGLWIRRGPERGN